MAPRGLGGFGPLPCATGLCRISVVSLCLCGSVWVRLSLCAEGLQSKGMPASVGRTGSLGASTVGGSSHGTVSSVPKAALSENREKALIGAVRRGDQSTGAALLRTDVNVNCIGEDGLSPLWHAVWRGDDATVMLLLDSGVDATRICETVGMTALHLAAVRGHTGIIRVLLEQKRCGVDAVAKDGMTALCLAAKHGHFESCEVLLNAGASPLTRVIVDNAGSTPIGPADIARLFGHGRVADLIGSRAANFDDVDVYADSGSIRSLVASVDSGRPSATMWQSCAPSAGRPTYLSFDNGSVTTVPSLDNRLEVPADHAVVDRKKKRRGCCNASPACVVS